VSELTTRKCRRRRHGVSVVGRLNVDSRPRMHSTLNTGSPLVPWSTVMKVHLDASLDLVQVEAFAFFSHLPILFSRFSTSPSCSSSSSCRVSSNVCGRAGVVPSSYGPHCASRLHTCRVTSTTHTDMRVNASQQKHSRWIALRLVGQRCACGNAQVA
jgi:hypothetical protein